MAAGGSSGNFAVCCFPVSDRLGNEWNDEDYDIRLRTGSGDGKHRNISDHHRTIHTACFSSSPGIGLMSLICQPGICQPYTNLKTRQG